MADLITHTCAALLWKVVTCPRVAGPWPLPPTVATFVLGTCLPDFIGRVPAMGLLILRWTFPAIPEWSVYIWGPFHMPIGIVLFSWVAAQAYRIPERSLAFRQLALGGLLHLFVDLLQTHLGVGYLLLFPFSMWDFEFRLIGSEDTVRIVPVLLPLTVLACWRRWGGLGPSLGRTPGP